MFLLALLLTNTVNGALDDLSLLHQTTDTEKSMVWPMLPNESLAQLAAKFYPNNRLMQRKFILKTKLLNKTALTAETRYKKLTTITIPNLRTLSVEAGAIKRARKKKSESLHLSYNIKPEVEKKAFSISSIPESLIRQYEKLLARNEFLKNELEKLNKRLIFLENKLGELKLVLDKTLTMPTKKRLNNLDLEKTVEKQQHAKSNKPVETANKRPVEDVLEKKNKVLKNGYIDLSNKFIWLGVALLALLVVLGSSLISKYRQRKYAKLVNTISNRTSEASFSAAAAEAEEAPLLSETDENTEAVIEEQTDIAVLQKAKTLVSQGALDEAISHLKWAIRAKPKISINTWLYLLSLFRQQNLKEDFETFATELHKNFNVMTPLWEHREVEMVVPQTIEAFPHIAKFLTRKWPNEKLIIYLKKLISDTRLGERSGFSLPVVQEILLLINILEIRGEVERV